MPNARMVAGASAGKIAEGVQAQVEVDLLLAAAGVDQPLGVGHSTQSPTTMSLMTPPLQARMVAILVAASRASFRDDVRPGLGQLAQPGETGGVAHFRHDGARYLWARVTIQAMQGRITSPQMSISSPDDRSFSS